jgi:hypothetical protein
MLQGFLPFLSLFRGAETRAGPGIPNPNRNPDETRVLSLAKKNIWAHETYMKRVWRRLGKAKVLFRLL